MKNLFMVTLLLFVMTAFGQTTYNLDRETKIPKTEMQLIGRSVKTLDKATYKNQNYPVYQSERGKKFIVYKNRNGNYTKRYIDESLRN